MNRSRNSSTGLSNSNLSNEEVIRRVAKEKKESKIKAPTSIPKPKSR
jgi:hypothetical protein